MDSTELYLGSISRLATLFHPSVDKLGSFEPIQPVELPANAAKLLAHNEHMTVTLEAFHNSLVDVHVVAEKADDHSYSRESLLSCQSDGRIVQCGFMRIWLDALPKAAQGEIRGKVAPLGRVLISHNLLRQVELMTLWRIEPAEYLCNQLEVGAGITIYGRTAQILVGERPTVQLLEIVKC